MYKYIVISKKAQGYIACTFNRHGFLLEFGLCCWGMNPDAHKFLLSQVGHFLHFDYLKAWVALNDYQLQRVENDLSFDRFWNEYDMARDRNLAVEIWDKLKDEERQFTLWNLQAYKRYLLRHPWVSKMIAKTYLRNNRHDDWDKTHHNQNINTR